MGGAEIAGETGAAGAIRGGSITAIVNPEGQHVVPPLTAGEGILVADLELGMNLRRKRLMDSVGHFSRPALLRLLVTNAPASATVSLQDLPASRLVDAAETVDADNVMRLAVEA